MDSSRQRQHYTAIHDAYEAHYYDAPSMAYRSRFIYRWLFDGVDFRNAEVADLACGSGHNSLALKSGSTASAPSVSTSPSRLAQPIAAPLATMPVPST